MPLRQAFLQIRNTNNGRTAAPAQYISPMNRTCIRICISKRAARAAAAAICLGAVALAQPALAALGDAGSTIDKDATQLRAQRSAAAAAPSGNYTVQELTLPSGTVVREYLTSSNQIFAVTWHGPNIPDLQQLLGSYYGRYSTAVQAHGRGRQPVTVQEPDLVVRSAGHARAFYGMAYLPQQFPPGLTVQQIR